MQADDIERVMAKINKKQSMLKSSKREVDNRPAVNLDHYSALPLQDAENEADDRGLVDVDHESDDELDLSDDESQALEGSRSAQPLWVKIISDCFI